MLGSSYDTFFYHLGQVWTWFSDSIDSFLDHLQTYDLIFRNVLYLSIIAFILYWLSYVVIGFYQDGYYIKNYPDSLAQHHFNSFFKRGYRTFDFNPKDRTWNIKEVSKKEFKKYTPEANEFFGGANTDYDEADYYAMQGFKRLEQTSMYFASHQSLRLSKLDKWNFKYRRLPKALKLAFLPLFLIKNRDRIKSSLHNWKTNKDKKIDSIKSKFSNIKHKASTLYGYITSLND